MAQVGSHGDDMTNSTIQALAFVGSLRVASYNQALLRAVIERSPRELEIDVFDLAPLPFYNADLEADGDPDSVLTLKSKIHASDLVFIVTPEYNQGMSAVTKNMIDWASRPPRPQAWDGKPVAFGGWLAAVQSLEIPAHGSNWDHPVVLPVVRTAIGVD